MSIYIFIINFVKGHNERFELLISLCYNKRAVVILTSQISLLSTLHTIQPIFTILIHTKRVIFIPNWKTNQ